MLHGSHGYCRASETNPGGHSEHSQAPKLDVVPETGPTSKVKEVSRLMRGGVEVRACEGAKAAGIWAGIDDDELI